MGSITELIKSIFTQHKMKLVMFSVLSTLFIVLMFPFGDLSDKITTEVSAATNNSVYLQFDDLSLTLLPQPALKMINVIAEVQQAPELAINELSVAPSLLALIKQRPLGRIYGEGFFKGDMDLSVSTSSKIKDPQAISADIEYSNFDVKEIFRAINKNGALPLTMSGVGQLNAQIDLDPYMKAQPDGNINLLIKNMDIPAFSIPLGAMGNLPMPALGLDKFQLKGIVKNGKFVISDSVLGSPKDSLSGKVTGDMDLRVNPNNQLSFGAYNLAVDITLNDSFQGQLGSYMGLLDTMLGKYKRSSTNGTRYSFRVQAGSFQEPASFGPL